MADLFDRLDDATLAALARAGWTRVRECGETRWQSADGSETVSEREAVRRVNQQEGEQR